MQALHDVLRKKKVKGKLESCSFMEGLGYNDLISLVRRNSFDHMIEALCCAKEEQPDLRFNEKDSCPTMVPLKCTLGMNGSPCVNCGIEKTLGPILDEMAQLTDEDIGDTIRVMGWDEEKRNGQTKGNDNTQIALTPLDCKFSIIACRTRLSKA